MTSHVSFLEVFGSLIIEGLEDLSSHLWMLLWHHFWFSRASSSKRPFPKLPSIPRTLGVHPQSWRWMKVTNGVIEISSSHELTKIKRALYYL